MRVLSIKKESIIFVICIGIIFAGLINSIDKKNKTQETFFMPLAKKIILIDAGHGGWDPGKVVKNNICEKDINLSVAKKLKEYLEQNGAFVLMTRVEDKALAEKKIKDMLARKKICEENENIDMMISVHQNSFPEKNVHGAQVFYYKNSNEGKKLADCIQTQLKNNLDKNNNRAAKINSSYFILKKIIKPSVIVECGFLSNDNELENLLDDDYQNKIAWGIYLGILDYYYDNK